MTLPSNSDDESAVNAVPRRDLVIVKSLVPSSVMLLVHLLTYHETYHQNVVRLNT
jgi:hypothetical protein